MTDVAIETASLTKRYGDVLAVDRLALRVRRGEIYAFLGLNGAGKTTTIRMLTGMVRPTTGEAWVLGERVGAGGRGPWRSVGYLVETPHAYPELTVRENLEVMRRLRPGVPPQAATSIIERLGLGEYAHRRAATLSLGNAQRLGLAKALLHRPDLLILDEPANGLDPAGIVEIRGLLRQLARDEGVTVFMSSHILGEVARLADRLGIIHQGRLLQELDIDAVERLRRRRLLLAARDVAGARAILLGAGLSPRDGRDGALVLVDEAAIAYPDDVATLLVNAGHPPTMLSVEHEDLERYFLRLVGMDEGDAE